MFPALPSPAQPQHHVFLRAVRPQEADTMGVSVLYMSAQAALSRR